VDPAKKHPQAIRIQPSAVRVQKNHLVCLSCYRHKLEANAGVDRRALVLRRTA
jgi:hypothetical protein